MLTHPGYSSLKINCLFDFENDCEGRVPAYTRADCDCPTCGLYGYDINDDGGFTAFGFVGNATGFEDWEPLKG